MPTQVNKYEILLTATPGTISLPVTDPYDLYTVTTSGTVTLGGATDIISSGTLTEGVTYTFKYTGDVTNLALLTIMGVAVPFNKPFTAEAYYNGTSWEVTFLPDLSQLEVLDKEVIIGNVNNVIDFNSTVVTSANVAGEQLLRSLEIPAHTFENIGDGFRLRVIGVASSVADDKIITVKSITGANTRLLFESSGAATLDTAGRFMLEVNFVLSNNGTGGFRPSGLLINNDGTTKTYVYSPNAALTGYDFINGIQYINIYITEVVPTGNQISIHNAIIERLRV